jgi:hypothetical protein
MLDDHRDDLEIVKDILLSAGELSALDEYLIAPVASKLKRYEGRIDRFNATFLSVQVRETLRAAIESSVAEGNGLSNLSRSDREKLQAALVIPGLRGQALRAKVSAYKVLWFELLETLKQFKEGASSLLRSRILELLGLMKDLWTSLIGPFPALEQVVEALGLLQQLFALSEAQAE